MYVNVEMGTGNTATNWIDSLQAAFPGVQVVEFNPLGKESNLCRCCMGTWRKQSVTMLYTTQFGRNMAVCLRGEQGNTIANNDQ